MSTQVRLNIGVLPLFASLCCPNAALFCTAAPVPLPPLCAKAPGWSKLGAGGTAANRVATALVSFPFIETSWHYSRAGMTNRTNWHRGGGHWTLPNLILGLKSVSHKTIFKAQQSHARLFSKQNKILWIISTLYFIIIYHFGCVQSVLMNVALPQ